MDRLELETAEQAHRFYHEIRDPTAKSILDFLIDHPDERIDGATLLQRLGLAEHRDVARSTYRMGQIAAAHGLDRPWTEGQLGYLMPQRQASLLRMTREQMSAVKDADPGQ